MIRFFRTVQRSITGTIHENIDLILLAWVATAVQALVPVGDFMSRPDLLPWTAMLLTGAVLLRGGTVGDGPHPMLTVREARLGHYALVFAQAATPAAILGWFDASSTTDESTQYISAAVAVILLLARWAGREDGRTSWDPPGRVAEWLYWVLGVGLILALVSALGTGHRVFQDVPILCWIAPGMAIGTSFLAVGLVYGRPQHARQRRAAGRTDGKKYTLPLFRPLLAFFGPALGFTGLMSLHSFAVGLVDFNAAFIVSVYVVTWAAILWPKPTPVAVHCLLHEVVPVGGVDNPATETASSFERPPSGALRLNPLDVKRTRTLHSWVVPIRDARIGALDDPVKPLWTRPQAPLLMHTLGEASFDPDPYTLRPQSERVTLRLRGQKDSGSLSGGAAVRRLVVLRAWPRPGDSWKKRMATWRWEEPVPEASLQIVDSTTEQLYLENGSVLVVSIEGVARAYELEIGTAIYNSSEIASFRPPQLEDYVGLK
jgi:hypothetical protein